MIKLKRYSDEPILAPIKEHKWEMASVFNCGVHYDGEVVRMLYRASDVWDKSKFISSIGYAASADGYKFFRFDKPVYTGEGEQEARGCEDPRITKLDDTFYVIYTGYSGKGTKVNMATTKNFITYQRKGTILEDVEDKDAALFPERINNKYLLLHRKMPNIWIAFSDDIYHWGNYKIIMKTIPDTWEEYKIGIAGPPLKTEFGWLLFYHSVDKNKIYRLGIALLDLNDPTKVIKRQKEPILVPELKWEKQGWVPNVVFSCGAVEINDKYFVYYGGADTAIGVATVTKDEIYKFAKE